jgi:hypothetical protein
MIFPPKGSKAETKSVRVTSSPVRTSAEVSLSSAVAKSSRRGSSNAISSAAPNIAPIDPPTAAPASASPTLKAVVSWYYLATFSISGRTQL